MRLEKFTIKTQEALQEAQRLAEQRKHPSLEPIHVLSTLLSQPEGIVRPIFERLGVSIPELQNRIEVELRKRPQVEGASLSLDPETKTLFDRAYDIMAKMGDSFVSTEHVLLALLEAKGTKDLLKQLGATKERIELSLKEIRGSHRVTDQNPEEKFQALQKYAKDLTDLARRGKLDPVIGRDSEIRRVMQVLTRRTKNNPILIGDPGVGKTAIVEGLAQRVVDGDVPETLKGKKIMALDMGSLIAGAKYRGEFEDRMKAVLKEVTDAAGEIVLFIDEIHTLIGAGGSEGAVDAANLLKPALARGELRCIGATTLDEYRKYIEKDPALERRFQPVFVDEPSLEDTIAILRGLKERYEVHHGVRITDSALVSAAVLSDRYITDRKLPDKAIDLIDEAASKIRMEIDSLPTELDETERRLRQLEIEREALKREKDKASKERLDKLEEEFAELQEKAQALRAHWKAEKEIIDQLKKDQETIEQLRVEADREEREGNFQKVAELRYGEIPKIESEMAQASEKLKEIQKDRALLKEEVSAEEVAAIVAKWTGVPVERLVEGERAKLIHMEDRLRQRVIGQEEAIQAVADAVRRSRAGLQDPNRPIGSFLFLGPTGVGKTELARALAEFLFNDEKAMVRIDMGEFQEKHSVARLIGAPPGYVGFEEGGYLTEAVRRRPYSVILLDEVEKAHPEVFNTLLQVLDDGRLTDGKGRTVNFKNSLIIMTSNLGSDILLDHDPDEEGIRERVEAILKTHFRPEFLNRIDETVLFHRLKPEHIREIVEIQLKALGSILDQKHITLEVSDEAKDLLAKLGYDPAFGARPLKRVLQQKVLNRLSSKLLSGEIKEGDRVQLVVEEGDVAFRVLEEPQPQPA
ncbi:MAG TPA: ATP-dependent chaperone ClpB [Planctomycetes bacterium]|nr:ATP-dependent chaperone ClpB [Planctomycetota bacterium]